MNQQRTYVAYLLRLWRESAGDTPGGDQPLWRASLDSPQSDERQGFASLDDLCTFLWERTGMARPADSPEKAERTPKPSSKSVED